MSCEQYHPLLYKNMTPREFSEDFKKWNPTRRHYFFKELSREYKKQSKEDKKGNKPQLSANLEELATTIYLTTIFIKKEENQDTDIEDIKTEAKMFGNTTYFYQLECFKQMKKELPDTIETTIKAMNKVCGSCKKHMMNPYA